MRKVLALVTVLSLATVASADLMVVVEPSAVPATVAGMTSYTVYLVGDAPGKEASAFDGKFIGPMNQVWFGGAAPTPIMDSITGLLGADIVNDSHLLLAPSDMAVARAPAEDGPGLGSYLSDTGNTSSMAIGIVGASQVLNLPFAQIVVPDGDEVVMVGNLAKKDTSQGVPVNVIIPEPATLSMLFLGGVAALIRRRR